ncbi:MAG: hypothetical protein IPL29_00040 [Propionivibrio sp.]|nr:hypothetical protein [Propionivibrio sp.]
MMKVLKQVDWVYTLYEDENGQYILDVVIPAPKGAWASYEKRVLLTSSEKTRVAANPSVIDLLVQKAMSTH